MHFAKIALALATLVPAGLAACPFGELARRGLVDPESAARYLRGEGLGTPGKDFVKREDSGNGVPNGAKDPPPLLDPISGPLSGLGLGSFLPRDAEHKREIEEHVRSRVEERDKNVDIDAHTLSPKAHKRYVKERGLLGGVLPPLTGTLQYLDVPTPQQSGLKAIPGDDPNHQYQAPRQGDIRGDCPTLNTLANHGYLARSGITTFSEAANAIQIAYSISFDLAVFLSALGLLAGGDPVTGKYSIGGQDSRVPSTLGPSYGIDRHGTFEIDASISRGDRHFGDDHSFNITRWNKLVTDANNYGDGLFTIEALKRNAADAVEESKATNPEFSFGPGFAVVYATRALLARPLPNGTAPDVPDYKNIAPFYLNETFPDYWYRIPNSYSLVDLLGDIGSLFLYKPQPLGNNYDGRFVPLEVNVPTAPADVGCFGFTALASFLPGAIAPEVQALNDIKNQLLYATLKSANCDVSLYNSNAGSNNVTNNSKLPPQSGDAGSGSGVTGLGQYDKASLKTKTSKTS